MSENEIVNETATEKTGQPEVESAKEAVRADTIEEAVELSHTQLSKQGEGTNKDDGGSTTERTGETVEIDGKRYTINEVRSGMMMEKDYRRKTADLAEKRRTYEAEIEHLREELAEARGSLELMNETISKKGTRPEREIERMKKDLENLKRMQNERLLEENRQELIERYGEDALSDWEDIKRIAHRYPGLRAWQLYLLHNPEAAEKHAVERLQRELEEKRAAITDTSPTLTGNLKKKIPETIDEAVEMSLRELSAT